MTDISNSFKVRDLATNKVDEVKLKGVRELKEGLPVEEAAKLTKNNGLDEIFFEANGKKYVGFTDASGLDDFDTTQIHGEYQGTSMTFLKLNDEVSTHFFSGAAEMTGTLARAVSSPFRAVANATIPNKATGFALTGGIAAGLLARTNPGMFEFYSHDAGRVVLEGFSTAGRLGIATGGVVGLATVKHLTDHSPESVKKVAKTLGYGTAGVAFGAALPDIAKYTGIVLSKIPEPVMNMGLKGLGMVSIAAVTGGALAIVGNGIAAATREENLKSLDQIAK